MIKGPVNIRVNPWEFHPRSSPTWPRDEHHTRQIGDLLATLGYRCDHMARERTVLYIQLRNIYLFHLMSDHSDFDTDWADHLISRVIPLINRCPESCHATIVNPTSPRASKLVVGPGVDLASGDGYPSLIGKNHLTGFCLASRNILMPDGTCVPVEAIPTVEGRT